MYWLKLSLQKLIGFLLYHTVDPLRVVYILSAQRSGSTLLKALLSQAPEIEHVNEINYRQLPTNKYIYYYKLWRMNPKIGSILLIKLPARPENAYSYPSLPDIGSKIVVLIRNPLDTIKSLLKIDMDNVQSLSSLINYWCEVYTHLFHLTKQEDTTIVRYEDLVAHPIEVTKRLFEFIESEKREGVDSYSAPKDGWEWGKDDGGKLIQQLKVKKNKLDYRNDQDLIEQLKNSKCVDELRDVYKIKFPTL